jgi:hypothetical protein
MSLPPDIADPWPPSGGMTDFLPQPALKRRNDPIRAARARVLLSLFFIKYLEWKKYYF